MGLKARISIYNGVRRSWHNSTENNLPPGMETWDILLIGKTGLGKSTTAIKLLEWDKYESSIKSLNPDDGSNMIGPARIPEARAV